MADVGQGMRLAFKVIGQQLAPHAIHQHFESCVFRCQSVVQGAPGDAKVLGHHFRARRVQARPLRLQGDAFPRGRGRFGANPPVRTTVACYGGIPGRSLVEIDCIAAAPA